jgi:hypothetical protein
MIEPAELRRIVREEIATLLAQERSLLLAEIRLLLKNLGAESSTADSTQAVTLPNSAHETGDTANLDEEQLRDGDVKIPSSSKPEATSEPLASLTASADPLVADLESQPATTDETTDKLVDQDQPSAIPQDLDADQEPEELQQLKALLAQKQALEAEVEALSLSDNTDELLNAFADQETLAPPAIPAEPDTDFNPSNPYFLGIDIGAEALHLCLADGITGRTYPLTADRLPLHENWQEVLTALFAHWAEYVQHPNLSPAELNQIFPHIQGVILAAPSANFDEQSYRLRQMVLQSGLPLSPESILVLERAIAPLLTVLHQHPETTDQHFYVHLHSQATSFGLTGQPVVTAMLEQGAEHLDQAIAKQLFPIISETSTSLELTRLCHQYFQAQGDSSQWQYEQLSVSRVHYEQAQQKGLAAWLEQLNRQINIWLSQRQEVVVGHVWLMTIPSILQSPLTTWLHTKFPHARLDYLPITAIAAGLSVAPFHRSALDIPRLQYSDYFLLNELCALRLPDIFDAKLLWQSLHQRGVNTRVCGDRLQAIINQGLPNQLGLAIDIEPRALLFQTTADGRLSACRDTIVAVRSYLQQLQYELKQNLTEPLVFPHFRQLTK